MKGWIVAFFVASASIAVAQDKEKPAGSGIDEGDWHFAPRIKLKGQYDDNIFLENKRVTKTDPDFYFILDPSIAITFKPEDNFWVKLNYELTQWLPVIHQGARRTEHDVSLSTRYDSEDVFYVRASGVFADAVQPIDSTVVNQVEILAQSYSIAPGAKWEYDNLELEIGYRRLDSGEKLNAKNIIRFFENDVWQWTLRERHQWTDEYALTGEFTYGKTNFFEGTTGAFKDDNVFWELRAINEVQISEEVSTTVAVAYHDRDYRDNTGPETSTEDFKSVLFNLGLTWKPDADNRLTLASGRYVAESPISHFTDNYSFSAAYSHLFDEDWAVTWVGKSVLGFESNKAVLQDRKIAWSGQMLVHYRIDDGWLAEGSLEFRQKITNDRTGEYDNWRLTVGVGYTF